MTEQITEVSLSEEPQIDYRPQNPPVSQATNETSTPGNQSSLLPIQLPDMSSQQTASVFHCLFKVIAICYFMFSGSSGEVLTFIIISVLLVVDFWTVKNVTGRYKASDSD